jgi:DNA-directed RNA polymerase specialized sigma24 family protein
VVLLQKLRQSDFVLTSSLKTYLYAIAKNLLLKRLRDNKLRIVKGELDLAACISESDLVEANSEEEKVESWLSKITRNCQDILKALFFYGE